MPTQVKTQRAIQSIPIMLNMSKSPPLSTIEVRPGKFQGDYTRRELLLERIEL